MKSKDFSSGRSTPPLEPSDRALGIEVPREGPGTLGGSGAGTEPTSEEIAESLAPVVWWGSRTVCEQLFWISIIGSSDPRLTWERLNDRRPPLPRSICVRLLSTYTTGASTCGGP